jgi:hypothetical protein
MIPVRVSGNSTPRGSTSNCFLRSILQSAIFLSRFSVDEGGHDGGAIVCDTPCSLCRK